MTMIYPNWCYNSDFIWDFMKLPFPSHLGKYFIKIGKISDKTLEMGKYREFWGWEYDSLMAK